MAFNVLTPEGIKKVWFWILIAILAVSLFDSFFNRPAGMEFGEYYKNDAIKFFKWSLMGLGVGLTLVILFMVSIDVDYDKLRNQCIKYLKMTVHSFRNEDDIRIGIEHWILPSPSAPKDSQKFLFTISVSNETYCVVADVSKYKEDADVHQSCNCFDISAYGGSLREAMLDEKFLNEMKSVGVWPIVVKTGVTEMSPEAYNELKRQNISVKEIKGVDDDKDGK